MPRGRLRVYLGSAPGVGKTYRMLDEGWRRRERGTDVVIGYVETHGRLHTVEQLRDLELVPARRVTYRDAQLDEMDLHAILARHPQVVLVDELAHTNVPGSLHEKRWQDVDTLLDAGVDVITTVNIQHLESVNDVVRTITGITQQETVPDAVVRRAEQIELVDVTPEALRRRMAHGNIYTADKIDASLSNYFREGNLTALRELALLWLADRVEDNLQRYQDEHDIAATWETRERLIVGVTGRDVDEVLLRRAARIASRSGAHLVAVHVESADGVRHDDVDMGLVRTLVAELDGTFHEIVDDDTAAALVGFARAERGTQVVLGASRPWSILRPTGGVVEHVLRRSPDLDVHVIAVSARRPRRPVGVAPKMFFSWRRLVAGVLVGALTLAALTVVLASTRSSLSPSTEFLAYLIVVLALATWSGAVVGVAAALAAFGLENFYFVQPLHTFVVSRPDDVVALVAYLVVAVGASLTVNQFARRSYDAERARVEARALADVVATTDVDHLEAVPLVDTLRLGLLRDVARALERPLDDLARTLASLLDGVATAPYPLQRERLRHAELDVQELHDLATTLLELGRLEAGDVTLHVLTCHLAELWAHAAGQVELSGHEVDVAIPLDLPTLDADPTLVNRVVTILLANAVRSSPPDRAVRVCGGAHGDVVELLVIDQGPGLSASQRESIVSPRSLGEGERAVDLSVRVAATCTRLLGGDLRLEDTPGGGLTVVVELPRSRP